MRTITSLPLFVCVVLSASSLMANSAPSTAATDPLVARGKYLVQNVGLCADCHSPRNERGEFIPELWLEGAPLPFAPTVPMPWSPAAPPIAGLPSMTEEQGIVFLQSGTRPDGSRPLPPMPEYRFDAEDARAVVAYLKSLTK